MLSLAAVAWSATESWKVSCVALTKVVGRATLPTCTVEVGRKLVPMTETVAADDAPVVRVAGASVMGPGMGLLMARLAAAEVPPPGAGLTAVSARLPAAAKSAAVRTALTCVELTYTVARLVPAACITVAGTKPVPVMEMVCWDAPATAVKGTNCVMVGWGLSISRLITALEALLALPLSAMTGSRAPWTSWLAATEAVTWVELTKVVASTTLPTWMVVAEVKPVPLIVRVVAAAPAGMTEGEMEATVGAVTAGGVVVVVVPEGEEEQPVKRVKADKQTRGRESKTRNLIVVAAYQMGRRTQGARGEIRKSFPQREPRAG